MVLQKLYTEMVDYSPSPRVKKGATFRIASYSFRLRRFILFATQLSIWSTFVVAQKQAKSKISEIQTKNSSVEESPK